MNRQATIPLKVWIIHIVQSLNVNIATASDQQK